MVSRSGAYTDYEDMIVYFKSNTEISKLSGI